jgi:endoglucanase
MTMFISPAIAEASAPVSSPVTVNQVGYPVSGQKTAMVVNEARSFAICDAENGAVVYEGTLGEPSWWLFSGEWVKVADFSAFDKPGRYYLSADGDRSFDFVISETVYDDLSAASLKHFYYNRASTALDAKYAAQWARKAGHLDDRVKVHASAASKGRPAGTVIAAPKGWYDAGDYNKYVVNSGISTYTLLALYEAYPEYVKRLKTHIPESGNNLPDLLDEALWNIEWLLAMQDPIDGGVYHKLTTKNFAGFVMPHEATGQRYVVKKSTAAALNFAAVMAQASRVFSEYEKELPGLSNKCLDNAVRAWQWACENPRVYYTVKQPQGITTGAYDDKRVRDEFAWAGVELYITTGDHHYYERSRLLTIQMETPTWRSVASLGFISLMQNQQSLETLKEGPKIRQKFLSFAEYLFNKYSDCVYKITNERFEWGSNALCLNDAFVALVAYEQTGNEKYYGLAQADLHYILGRNPVNYCYVTGFGSQSPKDIHHRVSYSDGVDEPVPGMMVGGPNHQDTWDCGTEAYPNLARPAKSYIDKKCSVSTNEVAINWNAALVYVVNAINANVQKSLIKASTDKIVKVSVLGNRFVDPKGQTMIFKGVALPDPVRLEATGHWNEKYFDEIKAWNCNIVRIPISPDKWRDPGPAKIFELLDKAVCLCKERGIYIVVDWHSNGNLHEELFQRDSHKTTKKETLEFWTAVAKRYNGENTISFYEIFNEPTDSFGKLGELPWDDWRQIVKNIVAEIRKYDAETIPAVAGLKWGYDLTEVKEKPFDIEGIAYSVHPYPMKSKEPWKVNWEKTWGYVADHYPMIALEFGYNLEEEEGAHDPTIGTEEFGKRIINYFTQKGISWTVWCFDWHWHPTLLKDESYEETDTQGAFFKNVLQNNITEFEVSAKHGSPKN